nr:DUF4157 domain-containing protein [uncultured Desulfobacter sp.]
MHTFAQIIKTAKQTTSTKSKKSSRQFFGQSQDVNSTLHLQPTIGNQAVSWPLQNKMEEYNTVSTGTTSPYFRQDFSRIPIHPLAVGAIQTKLLINTPGDKYEQEANRLAEHVMRMPEPQVQRKCSAQGCKDEDDEKKPLQTKPASAGEAGAQVDHPLIRSVQASPGQPLDATTRSFMEPRFGQDFSGVRVHTDRLAAESARAVNARAYTVGRDVVFGEGQYAPGYEEGRRLIAHELVHVGQQADVLCGKTRLFRQPVQSGKEIGTFEYDRTNFSDMFDGEVDTRNHSVTLTMRLAINDAVAGDAEEVKNRRVREFFVKARSVIEQAWGGTSYALKSSCMADIYIVKVQVLLDYATPHQTITLWNDLGERSKSNNWQLSDTQIRRRTSPVLIDPSKPLSKENIQDVEFSQITVVHEFGHLMGLQHPICKGGDTRCYGITFEQKNDVMGYGSQITTRDLAPFIRIMERYGRDHVPQICNTWVPVVY